MQIDEMKINRIVGYIAQSGDSYPFDILDTTECIEDVMTYYCINEILNQAEYNVLKEELLPLAEAAQAKEIAKIVNKDHFSLMNYLPMHNSGINAKKPEVRKNELLVTVRT